jgi:phosphatidyl-myo-inositol alpha-mannosyltransferase
LFLGRHEPRKGLGVLLEALTRPAGRRTPVGGRGGARDRRAAPALRRRPRIEWLGTVSESEKLRRLRGASLFCAPSLRGESFGIVLLEAMASGIPVVAGDIPGYANVARAGRDAILVPPGDPAALAAGVLAVLDDPARATALVASGRERADEFSMARLAELYVGRYERLLHRDAPGPGARPGRLGRR